MDVDAPRTTFADVARVVGDVYAARGRVYAEQGRVTSATWDPDGQRLRGTVRGSRTTVYRTVVDWGGSSRAGLRLLGGDCSCPMEIDCKHVAALALVGGAATRPPAGSSPISRRHRAPTQTVDTWESLLDHAGGTVLDTDRTITLGLQLSVRRPSAAGVHTTAGLSARLVRPGTHGWVNGNLDWQRLSPWSGGHGAHGPEMFSDDHVRIARAIAALASSDSSYSAYGAYTRDLQLASFEHPQLWALLRDAVDAGMPLRTGSRGAERVELAAAPAEVRLDITRPAAESGGTLADSGRRLTPSLWLDDAKANPVMFVGGATRHGVVLLPGDHHDGTADRGGLEHGDADGSGAGGDGTGDDVPAGSTARDGMHAEPPAFVIGPLHRPVPRRLANAVLAGTDLQVPPEDDERFIREGWMRLRRQVVVTSSDDSFSPPTVSGPALAAHITPTADDDLHLRWSVRYRIDGKVHDTPVIGGAVVRNDPWRDPDAEQRLLDGQPEQLIDDIFMSGDAAIDFVDEILPVLERDPDVDVDVIGGPLPDFRDVTETMEVLVSANEIPDDRDWFGLDVRLSIDGVKVAMGTVFAALAEGRTRLLLPGGAHVSLDTPKLQQLRTLIEEAEALTEQPRGEQLQISRHQADLWQELAALGVVTAQADAWQAQVDGLLADPAVHDEPVPVGIKATLRPYQHEGFSWLAFLARHRLGGILADDMGLGKTLQALAMIVHTREQPGQGARPFLVLAPASVVHGWADEAERFAPDLEVRVADATFKKMGTTARALAAGADVVITSYTRFRLDADHYRGVEWAGLILDEAQAVKNHRSKLYGCVRRLGAPQALAITGTPMENNLMELWSLLSITAPGLFPNPSRFKEHFVAPIERNGDRERLSTLRSRIRPIMLRRTKEEVAADLPPKQEQITSVPLTPAHRKIYDAWLQRERRKVLGLMGDLDEHRFTVLRSLTLMRLASLHAGLIDDAHAGVASAKLDSLIEHLHEVQDGGHRALVFSQFTSFLDLVRQRLDREGIGHAYLDGSTTKREAVVRGFREGDDPVFVISLKAGGVGLTLTEADYVFLLDPWWNPAVEAQAIDRTHRIGQTRSVMVYRLIAADTIEEKVLALSRRKADLVDGILDEGRRFDGRLTADDVQALFGTGS